MKTITLRVCPTVEAIRDKAILEQDGILAEVIPHYKAPSFYVGDNQISELLVREDQEILARKILQLPETEED
jgi:hypothetical protein